MRDGLQIARKMDDYKLGCLEKEPKSNKISFNFAKVKVVFNLCRADLSLNSEKVDCSTKPAGCTFFKNRKRAKKERKPCFLAHARLEMQAFLLLLRKSRGARRFSFFLLSNALRAFSQKACLARVSSIRDQLILHAHFPFQAHIAAQYSL